MFQTLTAFSSGQIVDTPEGVGAIIGSTVEGRIHVSLIQDHAATYFSAEQLHPRAPHQPAPSELEDFMTAHGNGKPSPAQRAPRYSFKPPKLSKYTPGTIKVGDLVTLSDETATFVVIGLATSHPEKDRSGRIQTRPGGFHLQNVDAPHDLRTVGRSSCTQEGRITT